jgi:UDP-N-acetyl-D-mannosaminuronic acid dehydrogenase
VAHDYEVDVCIVGGAGHVGFPLAVAFASRGRSVSVYDINRDAVDLVNAGQAPFLEPGIERRLHDALTDGLLLATTDAASISRARHVIVVVGTPVDQYLSPDPEAVPRVIGVLLEHLRAGQLLVLRSTVFPGVTRKVEKLVGAAGSNIDVAFCPERIAEGHAMTELFALPQIVASRSARAMERASALFRSLTSSIIELQPEEAELAKLFTNSWRYIKFAAANQYFMIANDMGLDFARVRAAMMEDYPRAADLPGAGFAAGPCLFKDTMQLASVTGGAFALGHSAMLVNEGLPDYVVRRIETEHDLGSKVVGILGMAFKAESDDRRSSLSYRLKRVLGFRAARVLTTDPYVTDDPDLLDLEQVLAESDLIVIATPHSTYRDVKIGVPVIDVWNLRQEGTLV